MQQAAALFLLLLAIWLNETLSSIAAVELAEAFQ